MEDKCPFGDLEQGVQNAKEYMMDVAFQTIEEKIDYTLMWGHLAIPLAEQLTILRGENDEVLNLDHPENKTASGLKSHIKKKNVKVQEVTIQYTLPIGLAKTY